MKAVLLSIKPNWCKLIWNGIKTVEITRPPQSWRYVEDSR